MPQFGLLSAASILAAAKEVLIADVGELSGGLRRARLPDPGGRRDHGAPASTSWVSTFCASASPR